jgi:hypothetical protein
LRPTRRIALVIVPKTAHHAISFLSSYGLPVPWGVGGFCGGGIVISIIIIFINVFAGDRLMRIIILQRGIPALLPNNARYAL